MRSAAGTRSRVSVTVILASLLSLLLCDHTGRNVYPVELRGVAPAQLVALLGRESARDRQLAALPVRVAGAEHHHVFLAGEAEPLARDVGIAGPVEAALDEVHVPRQVVARHSRRPRGLFEMRPAEAVHP